MKCKCDSPEGNLCNTCETEMKEVKAQALYDDGWWPRMVAAPRSINLGSSTNELPMHDFMYV